MEKLRNRGMNDDSQLMAIQMKLEAEAKAHLGNQSCTFLVVVRVGLEKQLFKTRIVLTSFLLALTGSMLVSFFLHFRER
jgi:hypothetical protein